MAIHALAPAMPKSCPDQGFERQRGAAPGRGRPSELKYALILKLSEAR